MAETGRYLFAVTRGIAEDTFAGRPGLRGAELDIVEADGLQGVVCDVELAEFGEEPLREHLEDLGWLEEVARAHNDVVLAVAEAGTVAPMRLVTILSDDASVRARLNSAHDDLTRALDRVQGRHEWSVKVYAETTDEPATAAAPVAGPEGGRESGAAYLQRKRRQAEARRSAGDRAAEDAESVHSALSGHAVAHRRLPPQDPRLTGVRLPMTLNAAYLVEDADGEGFRDLVTHVARDHPGAKIAVEGPWPPYSFAVLEDA